MANETRKCQLCGSPAIQAYDDPTRRRYECTECDGVEFITKSVTRSPSKIATSGFTTPSWWYHGWKPRAEWPTEWVEQTALDAIIQRGPETVGKDGICTECGRDYGHYPSIRRCHSDDCPSHWELVGLKHPEHA